MRRHGILSGAVGVLIALGMSGPAASAPGTGWTAPQCGQVSGADGSLTFTWSAGHHLAATTTAPRPVQVVFAIAALEQANTLLAVDHAGRLSRSTDAGCSWARFATLDGQQPYAITPAGGASAFVWSRANDDRLHRIDGTTVTNLPPIPVAQTGNLLALTVDPADGDHLRAVTSTGVVLDSVDGGRSFQPRGKTPTPVLSWSIWGYEAAFGGLDHIVLGTSSDGVFTTFDGGLTWARAAVSPSKDHRVNVFSVAVSPVDADVVWAMGLDTTEMDTGVRSQGRHIYRSVDGGRTFAVAVDHDPATVTLTNGVPLAPHPTDADVVHFEFGTWYAGYGTDLFTYDAATGRLSAAHNPHDGIEAIAFNPAFPQVMYLGLTSVR
ncbi:MAG: dispase autolysis-inducing protein [Hamadaea sp.]|nr:dispase autolysis-inducing protein [Hamadaea sp.]